MTELGIVMLVKPEQSLKHSYPKLVMELGSVMLVKSEQPSKQELPKLVTEFGMVMLVKLVQRKYLLLVDYQYYTF